MTQSAVTMAIMTKPLFGKSFGHVDNHMNSIPGVVFVFVPPYKATLRRTKEEHGIARASGMR